MEASPCRIEESLVPACIIEELDDGRFTVFVPSIPTPFAGADYILAPNRVHPLNVPFTQAVRVVSQWGAGSKDLVAATELKKAAWVSSLSVWREPINFSVAKLNVDLE